MIKEAYINRISKGVSLITLFPPIKGFDDFIGTWVYQKEKTFIVDVGPATPPRFFMDVYLKRLEQEYCGKLHSKSFKT